MCATICANVIVCRNFLQSKLLLINSFFYVIASIESSGDEVLRLSAYLIIMGVLFFVGSDLVIPHQYSKGLVDI